MTFTKQSQRGMGVEEDATEAGSERKGREWEKGLRPRFEGEKARIKMMQQREAISSSPSSSPSLLLRSEKWPQTLRIFQPEVYIHSQHPEKSRYLTIWVFLLPKTKLTPTTKTRGIITLNRKDSCYYRNTLHTNKHRVPAADSLGRLLGSPWEPPLFEHCCRLCFSVLWPWRAARKSSVATSLIVRWYMELQSLSKELPNCPCLAQFCFFCRTGRWPLAH